MSRSHSHSGFSKALADFNATADKLRDALGQPKRRRRYNGPTTEERMAEALAPILSEKIGTLITADQISIYAARGFWTHGHQDVQPWTGDAQVNGIGYSLGSWDNLWSALKGGFEVIDNRNKHDRAYSTFEVVAKKPKVKFAALNR